MTGHLILACAGLYLLGCVVCVVYRAALWLAKQPPEDATVANFVRNRMWGNLASLCVGVLGTGVWVDGSLLKWLHLGETVSLALSPVAGATLTYVSRFIVGGLERAAAARSGASPEEE